jgi:hypothetical protein
MLGTLTTSEELMKSLLDTEEKIRKDSGFPDYDVRKLDMPWVLEQSEFNEFHPCEGVYIGYDGNFPSYAFDQTRDLEQGFWWSFKEMEYFERPTKDNPHAGMKKNEEYLGTAYGLCDNVEQAKKYLKKFINHKSKVFVIWMYPIFHHPENAGQWGGFRPHKNGEYIGKYKKIIEGCEYFDDCVFPKDFQGYIFGFHAVRIQ